MSSVCEQGDTICGRDECILTAFCLHFHLYLVNSKLVFNGLTLQALLNILICNPMSSMQANATDSPKAQHGLCFLLPGVEIRVYEQEVIIVPILLLASFLVTLVFILLLRFCPEKVERIRPHAKQSPYRQKPRRALHGIDGVCVCVCLE